MKEIRIASVLPSDNNLTRIQDLLRFKPEEHGFKFVYDDVNPEYVLVCHLIYEREDLFKRFCRYLHMNCVLIFFAGECVSPDLNLFDYAICFDRSLQCSDRVFRLNTERFYEASIFSRFTQKIYSKEDLKSKPGFCNFMYSHSYGNRDRLFHKISEYKKVESIGRHLNNTGAKNTRYSADWRILSIEARLPYKFSIAAENAEFAGYVSEKILSCLEAGTIPIYWGDPTIAEEFNVRRFINCSDYDSIDSVLARIKELDENDDMYIGMLNEPWHTDEQMHMLNKKETEYRTWISSIFRGGGQPAASSRNVPKNL